ncbi:UTP-glucose-1-phosphate uridylyltransferase [Ceratobasidium sp. 395]|nr:UTP-glucose-1-phosphate uridylyltransferase [Ceratobasidium sp. 395]
MIFSGDDHDYCDIRHAYSDRGGQGPREVSVKSFSMAMGIRRPGFQLLSLISPDPASPYARTIADTPCHLPDQMHIYTHVYAICGFLSVALLVYLNATRGRNQSAVDPSAGVFKAPQRMKERPPVLRSTSLNVPTPRVLRSRSVTPLGSPIIPSSPILLPTVGDLSDSDHGISYPPSPVTGPNTPTSFFDLGGEEHSFSLPAPAMQQPRFRGRSGGWVEARQQTPWGSFVASARNLIDLMGWGCRPKKDAGFARRLATDFWACAWPPLGVLAFVWISLFW